MPPVSINAFLQPRDRNVCIFLSKVDWIILPETNITSENRPSQKENHLPIINFQGRTVSFRECIYVHAYRIKPANVSYILLELRQIAVLIFVLLFYLKLACPISSYVFRDDWHVQLWMQCIACQPHPKFAFNVFFSSTKSSNFCLSCLTSFHNLGRWNAHTRMEQQVALMVQTSGLTRRI